MNNKELWERFAMLFDPHYRIVKKHNLKYYSVLPKIGKIDYTEINLDEFIDEYKKIAKYGISYLYGANLVNWFKKH